MNRLVLLACAAAVAACFDPVIQDPVEPQRAALIVSTSLRAGTSLTRNGKFTVTTDGPGVVTATFGPRQVTRMAAAPSFSVEFEGREFPEGRGMMELAIQGQWNTTQVDSVQIDLTPPRLVRADTDRLSAGRPLRFLVWDAVMLGSIEVQMGRVTEQRTLPAVRATTDLVTVEISADFFPEGTWDLTVRLKDAAGNEGLTLLPSVIVDRTPPSVQFKSPAAGTHLSGTAELVVETVDNGEPTTVELRAAGSFLGEAVGPRGKLRVDTALFPRGPLAFEALPKDAVGNLGAAQHLEVVIE